MQEIFNFLGSAQGIQPALIFLEESIFVVIGILLATKAISFAKRIIGKA